MMPSGIGFRLINLLIISLALAPGSARAREPVAGPPPPKQYKVLIRYRILAPTAQRIAQYKGMSGFLTSIGFREDPGQEDEAENPEQVLLRGTIGSANARKILQEPHVKAILLVPSGYTVPAEAEKRVKVQLELTFGLAIQRQVQLVDQLRGLLANQEFRKAVGYDNQRHTRLVGTIPASQLETLLEDLRWQSSGWLVPDEPAATLQQPLRTIWPLVVIEVTPEPAGVPPAKERQPAPEVAKGQEQLLKIAGDLRDLATKNEPVLMEILLASIPEDDDRGWQRELALAAPGSSIQGHLGALITLKARASQAADLAKLPRVLTVRLPRPGAVQVVPALRTEGDKKQALQATGLDRLHAAGHGGKGVRVAVISDDFRGYPRFLGKQLRPQTRYVDITAESNPSIEPQKYSGTAPAISHGTQCALAVALAAPEADLTLIRIDPAAPYQLEAVARYLNGESVRSESLEQRREELSSESARLEARRDQLLEERKKVLDNFAQDKASLEQREAYFKKQAEFDRQERDLQGRERRYLRLVRDLQDLQGTQVVACTLVWNDGYPVDGSSRLSRYLDDRPLRGTLWLQAAGDTRGQVWAGLFRDTDGDGIMEFAPAQTPLPPGRWTSQLNFLGWQPFGAQAAADLPKGKVRISIQWREPHDPTIRKEGDDPYGEPLANLQLLVLRQRDPTGTKLRTDDMEVVAGTTGRPLRLNDRPSSATYEQLVEFAVDTPGRYAVQVTGRVPRSIRPANEPTLPILETSWELWPRLFVSVPDESLRTQGRPIFLDYATDLGNLGVPADAQAVISVGAVDGSGRPKPYSSTGPALGQQLHAKPDRMMFDHLPLALEEPDALAGTGLAASFAAGLSACARSAGMPPGRYLHWVRTHPGSILLVPPVTKPGQTK